MKSRYIFLILCAVPLSIHARAATGIAPECSRPTDVNSAMNCASKIHPGFNRSKLILDKAEAEVDRVSAFPNPELDTETLAGKAYGDEKFDFDIALVQTLEIGGARSARANAARAKQSVAHAEADLSDVALLMDSVGALLKFAQLKKELASIDESLATFKRLVTQYQGRPRLNPEQEVSLAVFKVSVGDYIIKRGDTALALAQTEEKIRSLGITDIPSTSANLPSLPTHWPKLDTLRPNQVDSNHSNCVRRRHHSTKPKRNCHLLALKAFQTFGSDQPISSQQTALFVRIVLEFALALLCRFGILTGAHELLHINL